MKVLIKLGGTLLDHPESLGSIAQQIAQIAKEHLLVVVHGGGKQVTRYLAERGVNSRFVDGLRVSDRTVIEAVSNVIAGGVNTKLVSAVTAAGRMAVGLSGVDGNLTEAIQLNPELEFVGRPVRTDPRLLDLLVANGYTPLIACLAGDAKGNVYNVNADAMAVSCAIGFQATQLLFLTDVGGVNGRDGRSIRELDVGAVKGLIDSGVAHGGMQAKLEAAVQAVASGVEVTIASGAEPQVALRLLAGEPIGSRLSAQMAQAGRRSE